MTARTRVIGVTNRAGSTPNRAHVASQDEIVGVRPQEKSPLNQQITRMFFRPTFKIFLPLQGLADIVLRCRGVRVIAT